MNAAFDNAGFLLKAVLHSIFRRNLESHCIATFVRK